MTRLLTLSIVMVLDASIVQADTLLCKANKHSAGQWIPPGFIFELPSDTNYDNARVLEPGGTTMGKAVWKKGWFQGKGEWSLRGLVKKKLAGTQFDMRYEFDINRADLSYKITATAQVDGDWKANVLQSSGTCSNYTRLTEQGNYATYSKGPTQEIIGKTEPQSGQVAGMSNALVVNIDSVSGPPSLLVVSCSKNPVTITSTSFRTLSSGEGLWRPGNRKYKSFPFIKISQNTVQLRTSWNDLAKWANSSVMSFDIVFADISTAPVRFEVSNQVWNRILANKENCQF